MCKRALSVWCQLIQLCIYNTEFDTRHIYDTSSDDDVIKTSNVSSPSRYNLRTRKNVKYTDDSDGSRGSRISSRISSRDADSREASSNDD
jgi:hypothetical protein